MTLSCVCRYPFLHYFAKTQTFSQIPPLLCCKIIRKSFGIVFMCTCMWIRFFFFFFVFFFFFPRFRTVFFFFLLYSSKKSPKGPLWYILLYATYRSPEIDI